MMYHTGACPGFLKGHQILKGSNGLIGGGVLYISLPRTTNLAYLDAKE